MRSGWAVMIYAAEGLPPAGWGAKFALGWFAQWCGRAVPSCWVEVPHGRRGETRELGCAKVAVRTNRSPICVRGQHWQLRRSVCQGRCTVTQCWLGSFSLIAPGDFLSRNLPNCILNLVIHWQEKWPVVRHLRSLTLLLWWLQASVLWAAVG